MFTFFIRSSCWEWFGLDCDLPCDFALNSKSLGHTKWAKYFANTLNSIQYCIVINPNAFWISTLIFGSFFVYCFNHHCVAISNLNEREKQKCCWVWLIFETLIDQSIWYERCVYCLSIYVPDADKFHCWKAVENKIRDLTKTIPLFMFSATIISVFFIALVLAVNTFEICTAQLWIDLLRLNWIELIFMGILSI